MKVLFYINVLSGGGAERVIANLANQLTENGLEVVLVTSTSTPNEYSVDESVKRIILDKILKGKENRISKNLKLIFQLRKRIKIEKPDVVISFMQEPNFRLVLATRGLKTKTIVSVRNDPVKEYPGRVGWIIGKILLPMADGCVFQTEDAKHWFPLKLQKKSRIIYNAVADEFYKTPLINRNKKTRIVVSCGRLSKQKNHKLLIEAFSLVVKKYDDVILKIYGEGELKNDLNLLIVKLGLQNKIQLMGSTSNVPLALAEASVFVLSSDFEGMPNALMEAMAMGLPCISTDCPCGGSRMLLDEGGGLLIPVRDKKRLYGALDEVLGNQEKSNRMSMNAKEKAQKFRADYIFQEWYDYIFNVLHDKNK